MIQWCQDCFTCVRNFWLLDGNWFICAGLLWLPPFEPFEWSICWCCDSLWCWLCWLFCIKVISISFKEAVTLQLVLFRFWVLFSWPPLLYDVEWGRADGGAIWIGAWCLVPESCLWICMFWIFWMLLWTVPSCCPRPNCYYALTYYCTFGFATRLFYATFATFGFAFAYCNFRFVLIVSLLLCYCCWRTGFNWFICSNLLVVPWNCEIFMFWEFM